MPGRKAWRDKGGRKKALRLQPWQKVAVGLVGPFPVTPRVNRWVLVLTDHFTRWQDALALPDAVVANALDERVLLLPGIS